MQSVSDDDVRKRLLEATFCAGGERGAQTGKMLHLPAGHSRSLGQQPGKHGIPTVDRLTDGTSRRLVGLPVERSDRLLGRLRTGTSGVVAYATENSSVFRCGLKVVTVSELFVTRDREFQTVDAVMLNALDWKLILVAG